MSDSTTPEPARPATFPTEAVASTAAPVAPAPPAPAPVAERPKRGVGAWSFVLGLLTSLGDIAFFVFGVVALVGGFNAVMSGDVSAASGLLGAAGLAIVALFVLFGGLVTAGIAALLGVIALLTGRGRVLAFFGLVFAAAAITVRVLILTSGFSPDLG